MEKNKPYTITKNTQPLPTEEEIQKSMEELDKGRKITEGSKRVLEEKELYEFRKKIMENIL